MERTVLVIEDDPLNRKLVHALLTIGGYHVREAGTAELGLVLAREQPPDCIVMDLRLPGMDGLTAIGQLKGDPALRSVPVIALTAFAMSGDEQKARAAGCDAYITKPIDANNFMGLVGRLAQPAGKPAGATNLARVLIVDDEPPVVRMLATLLRRENCDAVEAGSGEEAIRLAKLEAPDLVLMDVLMPGMDGYEATRRLKADPATCHVPVILITALSDVQDKVQGLEAGADEFLSKPFNQSELVLRIQNMLRLKQYEEQLRYRWLSVDRALPPLAEGARAEATPAWVLLLCDPGEQQEALKSQLEGLGHRVDARLGDPGYLFHGDQRTADLVILTAELRGADSVEVCRRLKEREDSRHVPLVVIAGCSDPEKNISFLTAGADDLLPSPVDPRELAARVARLLRQKAHLDLLRRQYRSALSAATNDGLTNLFNHVYFKRFLELEVKRSQRQNHPTSLLLMDLDDFKSLNDTLGHAAGDQILSEVARRLRSRIREIDLAARYGGEEFAVVLPYTETSGARVVAERIRQAISGEQFLRAAGSAPVAVTASMGIATCPRDAKLPGELIHAADSMLYQAKREGKNRICSPEG